MYCVISDFDTASFARAFALISPKPITLKLINAEIPLKTNKSKIGL